MDDQGMKSPNNRACNGSYQWSDHKLETPLVLNSMACPPSGHLRPPPRLLRPEKLMRTTGPRVQARCRQCYQVHRIGVGRWPHKATKCDGHHTSEFRGEA